MPRVLSLWFPTLSTDRITRTRSHAPPESAVLITRAEHAREIVHAACARAQAAGVCPGQTLAQARATLPQNLRLHCHPHRPQRDSATLSALARWALRITPTVATDPPDGIICDLTGTGRLWRSETRAARSAARALSRLGFCVHAAVAGSRLCAWAVARFGGQPLARIAPGLEPQATGPLPLESLGIDQATAQSLQQAGITRVAHLLKLPRPAVASRYGLDLLQRLDRITARDTTCTPERIEPIRSPAPLRASITFDGPTDRWESVHAALNQTLGTLVQKLAIRQRGVQELRMILQQPDKPPHQQVLRFSRPSLNSRHLRSMLTNALERADITTGVEGIDLIAARTAKLAHQQAQHQELVSSTDADPPTLQALGELIDTLSQRLGAESVCRFVEHQTHLPEHAFTIEPQNGDSPTRPRHQPSEHPPPDTADRPTHLLTPPWPATVTALTPDGPVMEIAWHGQRHRVAVCTGPERIAARWWRWATPHTEHSHPHHGHGPPASPPPPDRDYFALQLDDGRWLWVCRQIGTQRWFIHGQWA